MNDLITINGDLAILDRDTAAKIAEFERTVKEIKEKEDELKKAILHEMEVKNILKIDTGALLINYIATTDREVLDSKALKREEPDIYDMYCRLSPVKSSIRIKVR